MRKRLIYGVVAVVALILLVMVVKSLGKKGGAAAGKKSVQTGDSLKSGTRRARKTKDVADSLGRKAGAAAKGAAKLARSAGAKGKARLAAGADAERPRVREEAPAR